MRIQTSVDDSVARVAPVAQQAIAGMQLPADDLGNDMLPLELPQDDEPLPAGRFASVRACFPRRYLQFCTAVVNI